MFDFRQWCDAFVRTPFPTAEAEVMSDRRIQLTWLAHDRDCTAHSGSLEIILDDGVWKELQQASFGRQCEIGERVSIWLTLHVTAFDSIEPMPAQHRLHVDDSILPSRMN